MSPFSSLTLPTSAAYLSTLSEVWLLNFLRLLDFWNNKLPLILLLKLIKLFITVFQEKHYVPPSWKNELMLQQTYLGKGLKKPTSQHYALLIWLGSQRAWGWRKLHACVIRTVPVERISKMPRPNSNISQIQDMLLASFGRNCSIFQQLVSCAQAFYSLSLRTFNPRWIGPWMWCETALGPCAWVRHTWEPCPRHWKGSGKDPSNPGPSGLHGMRWHA